jgi:hypothetical protein
LKKIAHLSDFNKEQWRKKALFSSHILNIKTKEIGIYSEYFLRTAAEEYFS